MDEHDMERMLPGWQAASDGVARELVAWREAHPRASLTQIEDAVFEAMQGLQARALQRRLAGIPAVVGGRRWPVADHRRGAARHVQIFVPLASYMMGKWRSSRWFRCGREIVGERPGEPRPLADDQVFTVAEPS